MPNINDVYFNGHYKDIWKSIIPAELTIKETDFILQYFDLKPGAKVLDLMCGYGRHSLALAKKEITVTAVDNLDEYVAEIQKLAETGALPVKVIQNNALTFITEERFDLVLCMGNSLNFFNASDTETILANAFSFLKPGGHLLINTWSLAEIVIKNFTSKTWSKVGDLKFINDDQFLFHPTRIESDSFFLSPDGHIEEKKGIDYIYSVAEMETMLKKTGFVWKEMYSIPGRKRFTLGDPRAYIIAEKPVI